MAHSNDCFVIAFPAENREAFLEGHNQTFAYFGGLPRTILYDNKAIAVKQITGDGERKPTKAFSGLQSHYLFTAKFGRPGKGNDWQERFIRPSWGAPTIFCISRDSKASAKTKATITAATALSLPQERGSCGFGRCIPTGAAPACATLALSCRWARVRQGTVPLLWLYQRPIFEVVSLPGSKPRVIHATWSG